MMRNKKVITDVQKTLGTGGMDLAYIACVAREIYSLQARHGDLKGIEELMNETN